MAHTHVSWGPYGYSPSAKRYEKAVDRWLNQKPENYTESRVTSWESIRTEQAAGAMSCGFTGLAMIEGAWREAEKTFDNWIPHVYAHEVPTYYGMLAAMWRQNQIQTQRNFRQETGLESEILI